MNSLNDISDYEFVPFLHNLGVETYNKSFEWMLNDPAFAGVLRWMYNNLDQNNALTTREECKFKEIEKAGQVLSDQEINSTISSILVEYPGLCLPGDQDAVEDVNMDITMQKERLNLLEKQLGIIENLVTKNGLTKEQLNLEVTKLHAAEQQCSEDESVAVDECIKLAEEVETLTEGVIDVIADTLDVYSNCHADKELAKKFFTFGPFEPYRQSQALFRSHFDLYTSKKFNKKQNSVIDENLRIALVEARSMEERLTDAALAYIESKAELSGEQAKLSLVTNYSNVHPSQVAACSVEAQSALELLEQEELILDQQVQDAVKDFVEERTKLAVETTLKAALNVREQMHTDLSHLLDKTHEALALDRMLYYALRHELRTLEEVLQFTSHLKQYVIEEAEAVASRIDSMNNICKEQELCEQRLQSSNRALEHLCSTLGVPPTNDPMVFVKMYNELQQNVKELKDNINEGLMEKEKDIVDFENSTNPLKEYIWDGCTKQPNCWDRTVASLSHSLKQEMERVEKRVIELSSLFTSVKNGDKNCMRKLWQWFLTDPNKLVAAIKGVNIKNYSC